MVDFIHNYISRSSSKKRAHTSTSSKIVDDDEVVKENRSIDEDGDDGEVKMLRGTN